MNEDRSKLLAQRWDDRAEGYDRYFVPRFAPWVATTTTTLLAHPLPPGPILVPCCGTFPELPAIAAAHPESEIVGIDISQGMLARARRRTTAHPRTRLLHGDALDIYSRWPGTAAAVISVFGLQQLPDPPTALAGWVSALRPGGVLSVTCWPDEPENDGPFALLDAVVNEVIPQTADDADWHLRLSDAVTSAGAEVEHDVPVAHPIIHPNAEAFWMAMTEGGRLRNLGMSHGETFVAQLRNRFLDRAPAGPWQHQPTARLIVARMPLGVSG
ncbi:MAG: methyltransferase domain-containing protein [Acidimicrobiia bacterium]|nr:methyltransferase domain-containing protein [Acidimicrobiia bacterium]